MTDGGSLFLWLAGGMAAMFVIGGAVAAFMERRK